jgi:LPS export ABC transporter protein LptC
VATSLAAAGIHLLSRQDSDINSINRKLPDFYVVSPQWRQFDSRGQLARQLDADRLEHWSSGHPGLIEPRLLLVDRLARRWLATARRGQFREGQSLVLEQQVQLSREPSAAGPVVTSEYLRIADSGDRIETDRAVVIDSGSWHVSASGLRAELGQRSMQLLGNVRGIHE